MVLVLELLDHAVAFRDRLSLVLDFDLGRLQGLLLPDGSGQWEWKGLLLGLGCGIVCGTEFQAFGERGLWKGEGLKGINVKQGFGLEFNLLTVRKRRYLELLTDSKSQVVPEVTLLQSLASFSSALSFSLSFFALPPHFGSLVSFVKGELNTGKERWVKR